MPPTARSAVSILLLSSSRVCGFFSATGCFFCPQSIFLIFFSVVFFSFFVSTGRREEAGGGVIHVRSSLRRGHLLHHRGVRVSRSFGLIFSEVFLF